MDSDGLPLIGPGLDYTKIQAIHQKRTLAFLNHFITHTARFLNRFSTVCDDKLSTLTTRITRLESTISILEAKLNSVPGLENVTVASAAAATSSTTTADTTTPSSGAAAENTQPSDSSSQVELPASADTEAEPEPPAQDVRKVKDDPRYAKFLKMVHLGVPEMAVKQKMTFEGLNADLLDTPDAPMPDGGENSDSDDFSDRSADSDSSADFSD